MGDYTEYLKEKYSEYQHIAILEEPKETPKISIIVPCYNVEKFLEKCLDSLIRQTYKNFEIICVNDGSTDCTREIINGFSYVDKRIKIINQDNQGVSTARNEGLKIARGEYISFIDSDDWIDKNYFETLLNTIEKNDADIAAASIIRKRKNSEKYRVHYTEEKVYTTLEDKIKICDVPNCCYIWNKLYKKELIQNKPFKAGAYFEDILWTPDVLKEAKKIVIVPDVTYYYWVNTNSIVKTNNSKKQTDNYKANQYIIKFFDENGLILSKKARNLTKKTYCIGKLPVLKIKEYENKETFLLFGLIPFFKRKAEMLNIFSF